MIKVQILGTGPETRIYVDGKPLNGIISFTVSGESRDKLTKVTFVMVPTDLEIEGEMDVHKVEA